MSDQQGGSFEERLRAARAKQGADTPPPSRDTAGTASPMGIGVRVGIELVSALAVGVAIGWGLDWWLGTKPWLLGLFVLLGGAAGIANVWRLMMPRAGKKPGQVG
jgi:ATP synthase protein I